MPFKAVIFDIGGVVLSSPFIAIAAYERAHGLPTDYLNCSIAARGPVGAWQRFERGELELHAFYTAFGQDLSDTTHGNAAYARHCARKRTACPPLPASLHVDGRELFGAMMRGSVVPDAHVLRAITRLRAGGRHRVGALTNSFARVEVGEAERAFLGWGDGVPPRGVRALFDDFCDSSEVGLRKPDPAIYRLACARNGVRPEEAVFLDDIGANLKAAREVGMATIHVPIGGTLGAVEKLGEMLGMDLTGSDSKL